MTVMCSYLTMSLYFFKSTVDLLRIFSTLSLSRFFCLGNLFAEIRAFDPWNQRNFVQFFYLLHSNLLCQLPVSLHCFSALHPQWNMTKFKNRIETFLYWWLPKFICTPELFYELQIYSSHCLSYISSWMPQKILKN